MSLISQNSNRDRIGDCIFSRDNTFIDNIASKVDPDGWIEFLPLGIFEQGDLFNLHKTNLGLSTDDEMVLVKSISGDHDDEHYRYQQYYKGVPVECGRLIEHYRKCLLVSLNGKYLCDISMDVIPTLSSSAAITLAMNDMNGADYLWNDPVAELELKEDTEDPSATYYPNPELVIDCSENLVYKFKLNTLSAILEYRIDANNGAVISKVNPVLNCGHTEEHNSSQHKCNENHSIGPDNITNVSPVLTDFVTIGNTLFSGQQPIRTTYSGGIFSSSKHKLIANNYSSKIETRDNEFSPFINDWNRKVEQSGPPSNNFIWPLSDLRHTQTHWAAQKSYDYFRDVFNNSIGAGNGTIRVKSNAGITFAAYLGDNRSIIFGFRGGLYLGVLDAVGHELTHLVVDEKSELGDPQDGNSESNSLNESFGDIFGTLIEREFRPSGWDWIFEDEAVPLRDVRNPELSPTGAQPTIYMGANWNTATGQFSTPHRNGGVQNKWFSLLALGGVHNGINVDGIGIDKAAQITWQNLLVYIEANSLYIDSRNGAVQAAIDIFGECSFEHRQTMLAWEACGRGTTTDCLTQPGETTICRDLSNLPISVTLNSATTSPITWTPVDIDLTLFNISLAWGTSNWTFNTSGSNNNILTITSIPSNTLTFFPYFFRYQDDLGNSGVVSIRFADCLVSTDPDPTDKFNYCDEINNRSSIDINQSRIEKVIIYPNPVKDELFVIGSIGEESYRIIDISGREISNGKITESQTVSVSNLPNGIYIIHLINTATKELKYGKFIKAN